MTEDNLHTKVDLENGSPAFAKPVLVAGVVLFDGNNSVRIQPANYIEDGWYIDIIGNEITLWEIPYGGGEPIKIGDFLTVAGAIHAAGRLT
jgi:hypothetical protein